LPCENGVGIIQTNQIVEWKIVGLSLMHRELMVGVNQ